MFAVMSGVMVCTCLQKVKEYGTDKKLAIMTVGHKRAKVIHDPTDCGAHMWLLNQAHEDRANVTKSDATLHGLRTVVSVYTQVKCV